jgi:hypothetical protein
MLLIIIFYVVCFVKLLSANKCIMEIMNTGSIRNTMISYNLLLIRRWFTSAGFHLFIN